MKKLRILVIAAVVATLAACSTEVELNAPYDSKSIVYGLLDAQADTQFIKVNKTFLGNGNNLDYAAIRDSSEYPFHVFDVLRVDEVVNGNVVNSYDLDSLTINNKEEDGIFYAPRATVYYFETPEGGLNMDAIYRFRAEFNNGEESLVAQTDLVRTELVNGENSENIELPSPFLPTMNDFAGMSSIDDGEFPSANFKWDATEGAARYEVKVRFYYTEVVYTDNSYTDIESETVKYIDWFIGQFQTSTTSGSEDFNIQANGSGFFTTIRNRLDVIPQGSLTRRVIGYAPEISTDPHPAFDFILTVANEELDTYLEVTEPVTGVVQERPTYTNVANGIGLFASKATQGVYARAPRENTAAYLCEMFEDIDGDLVTYGFYTRDPRFQDFNCYIGD